MFDFIVQAKFVPSDSDESRVVTPVSSVSVGFPSVYHKITGHDALCSITYL